MKPVDADNFSVRGHHATSFHSRCIKPASVPRKNHRNIVGYLRPFSLSNLSIHSRTSCGKAGGGGSCR